MRPRDQRSLCSSSFERTMFGSIAAAFEAADRGLYGVKAGS
jgi:hypothetical protein